MKIYNDLLKEGVIVRPVEMENFLRISIGTTEENTYLLRALEKIL
jgi:histidinol-phosphate aminotransferase